MLIACDFCCPGKSITRCTNCYIKFARTIARRRSELEQQSGGAVYEVPALRALRLIDFDGLEKTGECSLQASEFLEPMVDDVWRWRIPCPSCYSFVVPDVEPQMPQGFASMEPNLHCEIVDIDAPQLDRPSGLVGAARPACAARDRLRQRRDDLRRVAEAALHRAADPPTHAAYATFWRPPPPADGCAPARRVLRAPHARRCCCRRRPRPAPRALTRGPRRGVCRRERWRLIRSVPADDGEEPQALSLVRLSAWRCGDAGGGAVMRTVPFMRVG